MKNIAHNREYDSVSLPGNVLTNHWHLEDISVTRKDPPRNEVHNNLFLF